VRKNEDALPEDVMIVRDRQKDDLPGCVAVLQEVHHCDGYPVTWMDDPAGWLDPPDPVGAWVAEIGGHLVGHLLLVDVHRSDILPGADALEIKRLFVSPSRRGRRIASGLIRKAIDRAGQRPVVLEVVAGNEAVTVYHRLGWQEITRRRADWPIRPDEFPELIWLRAPS
jgi:GNAT superfamily N-acetyltransferase